MTEVNPNGGEPKTQSIKIQGFDFDIPAPYNEGHVLNGAEASAMNQLYAENVRNNNASRIKRALEAYKEAGGNEDDFDLPEDVRQEILAAAAEYKFGERRTRVSEPADPVEREARKIAADAVRAALRAKGIKLKDVADEKFEELVSAHAKSDKVVKEAHRRVKEREKIGLDEIDLSGVAEGGEAAQAA